MTLRQRTVLNSINRLQSPALVPSKLCTIYYMTWKWALTKLGLTSQQKKRKETKSKRPCHISMFNTTRTSPVTCPPFLPFHTASGWSCHASGGHRLTNLPDLRSIYTINCPQLFLIYLASTGIILLRFRRRNVIYCESLYFPSISRLSAGLLTNFERFVTLIPLPPSSS